MVSSNLRWAVQHLLASLSLGPGPPLRLPSKWDQPVQGVEVGDPLVACSIGGAPTLYPLLHGCSAGVELQWVRRQSTT